MCVLTCDISYAMRVRANVYMMHAQKKKKKKGGGGVERRRQGRGRSGGDTVRASQQM